MNDLFTFDPHFLKIQAVCLILFGILAVCVDIWLRIISLRKKEMTTNERQAQALSTCMSSCRNISYMSLGLCEEVAELMQKLLCVLEWNQDVPEDKRKFLQSWLNTFILAGLQIGKFAKEGRHSNIQYFDIIQLPDTASVTERAEYNEKLRKARLETGDAKWMLLGVDFYLVYRSGVKLDAEHPATAQETDEMNSDKLLLRKKEDTIDGKGDEQRTRF